MWYLLKHLVITININSFSHIHHIIPLLANFHSYFSSKLFLRMRREGGEKKTQEIPNVPIVDH